MGEVLEELWEGWKERPIRAIGTALVIVALLALAVWWKVGRTDEHATLDDTSRSANELIVAHFPSTFLARAENAEVWVSNGSSVVALAGFSSFDGKWDVGSVTLHALYGTRAQRSVTYGQPPLGVVTDWWSPAEYKETARRPAICHGTLPGNEVSATVVELGARFVVHGCTFEDSGRAYFIVAIMRESKADRDRTLLDRIGAATEIRGPEKTQAELDHERVAAEAVEQNSAWKAKSAEDRAARCEELEKAFRRGTAAQLARARGMEPPAFLCPLQ